MRLAEELSCHQFELGDWLDVLQEIKHEMSCSFVKSFVVLIVTKCQRISYVSFVSHTRIYTEFLQLSF